MIMEQLIVYRTFRHSRPLRGSANSQGGVTLLESLVSILILAIGVLGMLGTQMRVMVETQTTVHRGQAVRLIEDLAERIKSNPGGFKQIPEYVANWTLPGTTPECATKSCDASALALLDLAVWKQSVMDALPAGQATLFTSVDELAGQQRQLGVMVAWRAKERVTKATDAKHGSNFEIAKTATGGAECPSDFICHLVYVQP